MWRDLEAAVRRVSRLDGYYFLSGSQAARLARSTAESLNAEAAAAAAVAEGAAKAAEAKGAANAAAAGLLVPGDLVEVMARSWPGMNKPGGTARVHALNADGTFIMRYVLGGFEDGVRGCYVTALRTAAASASVAAELRASAAASCAARIPLFATASIASSHMGTRTLSFGMTLRAAALRNSLGITSRKPSRRRWRAIGHGASTTTAAKLCCG